MKAKRGVVFWLLRSLTKWLAGVGLTEGHHVGIALGRVVDDRVEPHERIVAGGVLVGGVATSAVSVAPMAGWAQSVPPLGSVTPPSRGGVFPMSCS